MSFMGKNISDLLGSVGGKKMDLSYRTGDWHLNTHTILLISILISICDRKIINYDIKSNAVTELGIYDAIVIVISNIHRPRRHRPQNSW